MDREIKTHIANYLGKCRSCEHWTGGELGADDDEICEISTNICLLWVMSDNSERLVPYKKED